MTSSSNAELYAYSPSHIAAIGAAALFGISAILHLVMMIRKKAWFYTAMTAGAFMMTLGYVCRYLSSKNTSSVLLYALQSLLLILPPSLYAATIYMIYGRIVVFVQTPEASVIHPLRVTKIFVCGDVLAFCLQAGGGGMMTSNASLGQKVILVGLFAQLLFFGFFLVIAFIFRARMAKSQTHVSSYGKHSWNGLLTLLLAAAILIILRCLYRVAEFALGSDGFLMEHEAFMYIADAGPMFIVQAMFNIIHAGDVFPEDFVSGKLKDIAVSESYINLQERV